MRPAHAGCRGALEAMLENADALREAASILRPLYEVDGLHQKLLRVLEIEAEFADSVSDKLANIAQAAQVAEGPLGDSVLAFSYAARGLRGAVAEPELPQWLERAERLASATGRHGELVELLRSVVGEILDGDVQLEVTLRIAEIARTHLKDTALAQQHYARALELRGDDRRALLALQSLYEETGDHPALLDVVKRRADAAESEGERGRAKRALERVRGKLRNLDAEIGVIERRHRPQVMEREHLLHAVGVVDVHLAAERLQIIVANAPRGPCSSHVPTSHLRAPGVHDRAL